MESLQVSILMENAFGFSVICLSASYETGTAKHVNARRHWTSRHLTSGAMANYMHASKQIADRRDESLEARNPTAQLYRLKGYGAAVRQFRESYPAERHRRQSVAYTGARRADTRDHKHYLPM